MKRHLVILLSAVALLATAPASATTEVIIRGRVETATLTPTVPRLLYLASTRTNGTAGWVAEIPAAEEGRSFEVAPLEEATGLDIDVWFYRDLQGEAGMGDPCPRDATPIVGGGEMGTVCSGAAYAVVVLFSGADVPFELRIT